MFNAKTPVAAVASHFSSFAKQKHFLITGSNQGLGFESAKELARNGAMVTICSRKTENGEKAIAKIKEEVPDAQLRLLTIDLSDMDSIKAAAEKYLSFNIPLDVLIANAGVMAAPYSQTKQGFEMQFGVNHLGHFYLFLLLKDLLHKSATPERKSRVVVLSSMAQNLFAPRPDGIVLDNVDGLKTYNPWTKYGESKLANVLFAREINNLGLNIEACAVNPGNIVGTSLYQHVGFKNQMQMVYAMKKGKPILQMFEQKNLKAGASTQVYCALVEKIEPKLYEDCGVSLRTHPRAYDDDLGKKLWTLSEEMIQSKL